jgi:hypothetical protein
MATKITTPIKTLLANLKAKRKERTAIENEITKIGREIIDQCPKKKGDIVTVNAGYSHKGKQLSITRIAFDPSTQQYEFDGLVLRGDGSTGLNRAKAVLEVK